MSIRATLFPASAAVLSAFGLGSCNVVDYDEAFTLDAAPVLHLIVDHGDIELVATDTEEIRVERGVSGWKGSLRLSSERDGDIQLLIGDCTGVLECRVDTRVEIPAGTDVIVELGSGNLWLEGLRGELDLTVRDGGVSGRDLAPTDLLLSIARGDLDLRLDVPPARTTIAVGQGDARVELPAGAYALDATVAGGGAELLGIEHDPSGRTVEVAVAGGELSLRGR